MSKTIIDPNALTAAGKPVQPGGATQGFTHICEDGRTVVVAQGKGKDAVQATRLCNNDQANWIPALMSILGTIDGKPMPMEEWLELPLRDYMQLAAELGGNFI